MLSCICVLCVSGCNDTPGCSFFNVRSLSQKNSSTDLYLVIFLYFDYWNVALCIWLPWQKSWFLSMLTENQCLHFSNPDMTWQATTMGHHPGDHSLSRRFNMKNKKHYCFLLLFFRPFNRYKTLNHERKSPDPSHLVRHKPVFQLLYSKSLRLI